MLINSKLVFIRLLSGVVIYPGMNETNSAEDAKLTNDKDFKTHCNLNDFEIMESDSIDKDEKEKLEDSDISPIVASILSANVNDACELVDNLLHIELLREALTKETQGKSRKKVLLSIESQIKKLEEGRKEGDK